MPAALPLIPSLPNYRIGVQLDTTQYLLDVRWNARDNAWYMDLLLEDETPIRNGMKLVLGALPLRQSTHPDLPTGQLIVSDLTNEGRDATLDDLGDRVQVYYFTAEELAAL